MVSFLENIPFYITPISPIHIGNGDEGINWSTSIADERYLYILDFLNINLPAQVMNKIRNTSLNCKDEKGLLELQSIYKGQKNDLIDAAYDKIALPPELAKHFINTFGRNTQANNPHDKRGKATINKLNVDRCVFNSNTLTSYIPGSSIKGAIRTAYLSTLAKKEHVKCKKRHKSLHKSLDEKKILGGSFDRDPFRLLKVEDSFASQKDLTQVFYLVMKKREKNKNSSNSRGVPQYLEAVIPFNYRTFTGSLSLQSCNRTLKPPSLKEIIDAVNKFNISMFEEQKKQLQNLDFVHQRWLVKTEKLINGMDKSNNMLIRLGKLCTAESKTVDGEGLRKIKIRNPKHRDVKISSHGTTFWLAGDYKSNTNLLPMGWAIIELKDTNNKTLQNFCHIMAEEYSCASNNNPSVTTATYNIPDDYDKAIEWLEKLLNSDDSNIKEKFAAPVIELLEKAQKWPLDTRCNLFDIFEKNYDFGKRQDDINYLLDSM